MTAATARTALAAVALPGGGTEVRSFPLPPSGADSGLLRVEASGVCGTDVSLYADGVARPTVLGHHVHGRITEIGDVAARRWGVAPGDRVVIEEYLPCRACGQCAAGRYRLCPRTDLWHGGRRVGLVPADEEPSLWGGNAQYLYLPPEAVVHPVPEEVPEELTAWTLPLANALDWVRGAGELRAGETVVILGPGHHGLAAVTAALHGGAGTVVVAGLARDRARLEIAADLGADTVELTETASDSGPRDPHAEPGRPGPGETGATDSGTALHEHVARLTGGRMADVVLDLTGSGAATATGALGLLAHGGRIVVAGGKGAASSPLDTGLLTRLTATVRGVRGRAPERVTQSIRLLATAGAALAKVPTVHLPLDEVGPALDRLAAGTGPQTPHVVVRPWADPRPAPGQEREEDR
ncbi:alcohol dehydrogenase catalytic domain-containing protein [Streptomyces sp. SCSIO 75703]|uniref:zinc-dependent alcohol dehydrogenase n=1 Tax=unclassified Streptomyces TaxID=2593676 RepID=UPI00068D6ABE|nr:alcohol dehydrogenase catalytic domain-containing protein [Streptomyces sp. NRRL F-5065]